MHNHLGHKGMRKSPIPKKPKKEPIDVPVDVPMLEPSKKSKPDVLNKKNGPHKKGPKNKGPKNKDPHNVSVSLMKGLTTPSARKKMPGKKMAGMTDIRFVQNNLMYPSLILANEKIYVILQRKQL